MPIVPTRLGDIDVTIMTKSQVAKQVITRTIHVEVLIFFVFLILLMYCYVYTKGLNNEINYCFEACNSVCILCLNISQFYF